MSRTLRHRVVLAAALTMVAGGVGLPAARANAATTIPFNWNVDASTTLAKLKLTVDVHGGTFSGAVDVATGALTGDITLPPSTKNISLGRFPLASATFAMTEARPVTGTVNLSTLHVTTTATFNIRITNVTVLGLPFNLVGNGCTTSHSIPVTMSGTANLAGASKFSGTYTIPQLVNCGPLTPLLNLVIPGPGNSFAATATPKT